MHGHFLEERVEGAADAALRAQVALEALWAAVLAVGAAHPGREGAAVVSAAGRRAARGVPGANVAVFARGVPDCGAGKVSSQLLLLFTKY